VWTLDDRSSVPAWRLDSEPPHVRVAFSTRLGGVSAPPYDSLNLGKSTADLPDAVAENRRRFLSSLDLDGRALATAGQVHGSRAAQALRPGVEDACDALWTTTPGLILAVSAADCLPVLLTTERGVAAAHAGWRGLTAGVVEAALEGLCRASEASPARVHAHLGPCIRECCYVVGPEVARQFPSEALHEIDGTIRLSLPRAARRRLLDAGVPVTAILDTGACSACAPRLYFSHRRDRGRTGRQWGIAALLASP
jgi:YfiH family protein